MGGSSKKVTVGYKYYLGMHMVLCHGPIDRIKWIKVDDRIAWQGNNTGGRINVSAENLFGGESREGGISGAVDIAMGRPTQGRNDYLQARLGSSIPAFRGVVGAILRQCYLGLNPYLKKWAMRGQRIHVRQDGLPQWYDAKAEIGGDLVGITGYWQYQYAANALPVPAIPSGGWSGPSRAPFGRKGPSSSWVPPYPINTSWPHDTGLWLKTTVECDGLQPVHLYGQVENAAFVYWDGQLVGSVNPTNVDVTTPIYIDVTIPVSSAAKGTHTIHIFALDDFEPYGDSDNTYVYCEVDQHADMNPAHIIRECLTDPDWGMGYQESDIDDASFITAADTLFDEQMGISLLWDRQIPIEDFVNEIVKHISAALYVDRTTGKFVLKLIRDDYDVEDLLVLDEQDIEKVEGATRPTFGELVNSVTVNYWQASTGKTASVTVQDSALIQMQGAVINTTLQYPGFTNSNIASRVALRGLRTFSTPLLSCTVYASRKAAQLNIGDAFVMNWPDLDINNVVVRVSGMALGDGKSNKVKLTVMEDVFATPAVAVVTPSDDVWEDPNQAAEPSPYRLAFETPYYEVVQAIGQTDADTKLATNPELGYVAVAAVRPGNAINATLSINSGAGYEDSAVVDFCPTAILVGNVGPMSTSWVITSGVDLDLVEVGTHAQIDGELVRIDAIDTSTGALTVGRGVLDTAPRAHADGARIFFWDVYSGSDQVEYVDGETIYLKVLPTTGLGSLPIAEAPEDSVTLDQRALRPYVPGRFRIDGLDYPVEIFTNNPLVSWAHRDRVQQTAGTLIDHTAGDIGPEVGTTYTIQVYNESGVLEAEHAGVTGTSLLVDLSALPSEEATIMLWSERGGLRSWQAALATFTFPFAAIFIVLPLTYDEEDHLGEMTWVRSGGAGPHVTPSGFEGDGYEARLKSTTIPTWMSGATTRVALQASVKINPVRLKTSAGDTVLHMGADAAGASPTPKLALKVLADAQDATKVHLALQGWTTALQTLPLARPEWKYQFRLPVLEVGGNKGKPQALYFIDANTIVVTAHYEDTESKAFKVNINTGELLGQFTFATHVHIASFAKTSGGAIWALDYVGKRALEIDLDASFTAGTVQITKNVNLTNFVGPSSLEFITVSGTEYALMGEYATTGTPYLYVYPLSAWTDGSTPTVAGRYKRFNIGQRNQGTAIKDGHLYVSKNRNSSSSVLYGYIERYNNIATIISGTADGATVTFNTLHSTPSKYPEDLKFHPTTGELWTGAEGWDSPGDLDGWLSFWSSPLTGAAVENHYSFWYDGSGSLSVKINGRDFQTLAWSLNQAVATVSVGGPPQASAGMQTGFFNGYIRNIRFQNAEIQPAEYADTIAGTTYEPNSLTTYTFTVTNPGAESGTTGWTNEVGTIATRATAPVPYEGAAYFSGGSNAQTIARQRLDILTQTGLTGAQVDAGNIWAKVRWQQASYTDQDPCAMGLRMLNSTPTQISLTYAGIAFVPYGDSGVTPNWYPRCLPVSIPSGGRFLDAVYRSDRNSGTNNDGYIDAITVTVYRR